MTIDNTAMDVIISTVTAVVQEPTISTITATVQDNIVQIPFDVISQIRDFYEICWSKLMWYITGIGAIGLFVLGYLIPTIQNKQFKKLLLEQKNLFDKQIDNQKKEFDNKVKELEQFSYKDNARLFRNTAVLLEIHEKSVKKEELIKARCFLWCSAIKNFLRIGSSIYEKDNIDSLNIMVKALNKILNKENKDIVDKNQLKEVVYVLRYIDKAQISADLEDNINNITEFYNSFDNANKKQ